MMKNVYIYVVLFATLMMIIGGSVAILLLLLLIISHLKNIDSGVLKSRKNLFPKLTLAKLSLKQDMTLWL